MTEKEIIEEIKRKAEKYTSTRNWYCGYRAALYELLAWYNYSGHSEPYEDTKK